MSPKDQNRMENFNKCIPDDMRNALNDNLEDYNGENILPQTESVVEAELEAVATHH